jgi:hypothetical protein
MYPITQSNKCLLKFKDGTLITVDLDLLVARMTCFEELTDIYPGMIVGYDHFEVAVCGESAEVIPMNKHTLMVRMPDVEKGAEWEDLIIPLIKDEIVLVDVNMVKRAIIGYGIRHLTVQWMVHYSDDVLTKLAKALNCSDIEKFVEDRESFVTNEEEFSIAGSVDEILIAHFRSMGVIPSAILAKWKFAVNADKKIGCIAYDKHIADVILDKQVGDDDVLMKTIINNSILGMMMRVVNYVQSVEELSAEEVVKKMGYSEIPTVLKLFL